MYPRTIRARIYTRTSCMYIQDGWSIAWKMRRRMAAAAAAAAAADAAAAAGRMDLHGHQRVLRHDGEC